jgi:hypothetical protein
MAIFNGCSLIFVFACSAAAELDDLSLIQLVSTEGRKVDPDRPERHHRSHHRNWEEIAQEDNTYLQTKGSGLLSGAFFTNLVFQTLKDIARYAAANETLRKSNVTMNNGISVKLDQEASPENSVFLMHIDHGCKKKDREGSDADCKFRWGDRMSLNGAGKFHKTIEEGSTVDFNIITSMLPDKTINCKACGEACSVSFGGHGITIPSMACPVQRNEEYADKELNFIKGDFKLPNDPILQFIDFSAKINLLVKHQNGDMIVNPTMTLKSVSF